MCVKCDSLNLGSQSHSGFAETRRPPSFFPSLSPMADTDVRVKRCSFDRISTLRQLSASFCKSCRDCCLVFWHQESNPDSFLILPSSPVFPKASTGAEAAASIFIARLYGSRVVLTPAFAADHLRRDFGPSFLAVLRLHVAVIRRYHLERSLRYI